MGTDITYEQIGTCTYRIYHKTYYDCTGAATTPLPGPPPAVTVNFVGSPSGCTPSSPQPSTSWIFVSYMEVTPIAPGTITACTTPGAAINGVLEAVYYADYNNLCNGTCDSYTLTWSNCCRNYAITSGAAGASITLNSAVIDLTNVNSSPSFSNPPISYLCSNQFTTYNQGAYDVDGDSLVYSLGPCLDNTAGTPVVYNTGYSPLAPLGPTWTVNIDPQTGDITFDPTLGGAVVVGVLGIYITEFRNGIQVGQISRDMQVTVLSNCGTNRVPQIQTIANISGGVVNNNPFGIANRITAVVGTNLSFDIPGIDLDSVQTVTMYWNRSGSVNGVTFSAANNASTIDTIVTTTGNLAARFNWTPTITGRYEFLVTLADNYPMSIRGMTQRSYIINVANSYPFTTASIQSQNSACKTITATANPVNGLPPYSYSWYGNVPTSTSQMISHTFSDYDNAGSPYIYIVKITDALGQVVFQTDSILFSKPNADFTVSTSNNVSNIQSTATGGQSPYSYQWWLDGVLQSGQNSLLSLPNLNGQYTIQSVITDALGCTDTSSQTLTITGVDASQSALASLKVIPNPSFGNFRIEGEQKYFEPIMVEISDINGKVIASQQIPASLQIQKEMNIASFARGLYFLKMTSEHGTKTIKLVKE